MLVVVKPEPINKTFPQANDIYKLIKFVDEKTFNFHEQNLKRIKLEYVKRQYSYYKSAANYLGLLKDEKPTDLALSIFKLGKNEVLINIVNLVIEKRIFYNYYEYRDIERVKSYLMELYKLSYSTATRRASTVKAWVYWCDHIIKENKLTIEIADSFIY